MTKSKSRKPGRPRIASRTLPVNTTMPAALVAQIDEVANYDFTTRQETVRLLLSEALAARARKGVAYDR